MSLAPRRASWSPTTALSSATKPPQSNLRLDQPGARYHSLEQLATRQTGDCLKCFRFSLDKQRWVEFLVTLERRGKVSLGESGPIRTALDLGAGTGGFLAALADRGVQGLGFSRNWGGLPYLETAAARGVLVVHLDFRRHIPMSPGAVDLLHCAWLMNVLSEREELEAMLMEWDRVVRPGGLFVEEGFRSRNQRVYRSAVQTIVAVSTFLQWERLLWNNRLSASGPHGMLQFIFRKPLRRLTLGVYSRPREDSGAG